MFYSFLALGTMEGEEAVVHVGGSSHCSGGFKRSATHIRSLPLGGVGAVCFHWSRHLPIRDVLCGFGCRLAFPMW